MSDDTTAITVIEEPSRSLFRTHEPAAILMAAQAVSKALAPVIEEQQLYTEIGGRRHVRIEGWTLLGALVGVFPVTVWCRDLPDGVEARVEARTLAGELVGAAEAACTRDEPTWANRPYYALRSMAATRAASKALRMPLGFIMSLAGFEGTPAEEMDGIVTAAPARAMQPRQQVAADPAAPMCPAHNRALRHGDKGGWYCPTKARGDEPANKNGFCDFRLTDDEARTLLAERDGPPDVSAPAVASAAASGGTQREELSAALVAAAITPVILEEYLRKCGVTWAGEHPSIDMIARYAAASWCSDHPRAAAAAGDNDDG